ncbi:hypothetical protein AGABI2DRAFT_179144, partial [Agaricus bisporus var. bisporus H97]|uniref:hypothetical protein n=1 Tax=Agaricus bisporus var. bisporus (strain H97 / ATCC MYA-4626 / FGSC 10389) TaxID=936046 RepID=UPI00029F6307
MLSGDCDGSHGIIEMGSDGNCHFIPSSSSSEDVQRTPAIGTPQSSTPKPRSEAFLPGQADISLFSGALRDVSLDFTEPREISVLSLKDQWLRMSNTASALGVFESPGALPHLSASIEIQNSSPSLPRFWSNAMFVPASPEVDDTIPQASSPALFSARKTEAIERTVRAVDDDAGEVVEDGIEMERLPYPLNQDRTVVSHCMTGKRFSMELKKNGTRQPYWWAPVLVSHSSPEQIASYVSLTTGLFGFVLALAVYRHHKFRKPSSPVEILAYIHGSYKERHDNVRWEQLFLMWSLPHALIMWSATTFSVAFLLMCFHGTLTAVKVAVGLFAALLGAFTLYYVLKYGSAQYDQPQPCSSTRTSVSEDGTTIAESLSWIYDPTSPSYTRRYDLNRTIKDEPPKRKIKPFSTSSTQGCETLPQGWQRRVHPEGLPYFYLPPSDICSMRVVTEEWLYDPEIFAAVQSAIRGIHDKISQTAHDQADNDLFVVLHHDSGGRLFRENDGKTRCGYYLVNHLKRCIYWAEEVTLDYELSLLLHNVRGELSGHQADICLEAEYWTNWDNFPNLQKKKSDTYDYVVETILDVMTDIVSSDTSAFGYTYEELQKRLEIVRAGKDCESSNWHIGRFMKEITSERLRNYYGAKCARLSRDQAVFEVTEPEELSILLEAMSPLLFLIPHAQLQRVKTLIVDQTVVMLQWNKLFDQLQEEWNHTVLIATIILAANCAFLAIPLFQGTECLDTHSSPEQVASYVSLTTSLFGLVLGMVMFRHHKTRKPTTPDELEKYIYGKNEHKQQTTRIQHLFLVWSLPQALVM